MLSSLSSTRFDVSGILQGGVAQALRCANADTDYRSALCRWEDDLFAEFPAGHHLLDYDEAARMIGQIFRAVGRPAPALRLVPGFDDPRVGGYADVGRHCIAIETGFLYRFLVLHECAHILVPHDRNHGPAFTYLLQLLYRLFIGIPEEAIQRHLERHGLPSRTAMPEPATLRLAS
jgi:hypothetical protein